MKDNIVIIPIPGMRAKVFNGARYLLAKQFHMNVTHGGAQNGFGTQVAGSIIGAAAAIVGQKTVFSRGWFVQDITGNNDSSVAAIFLFLLLLQPWILVRKDIESSFLIGHADNEGIAQLDRIMIHGCLASPSACQLHLLIHLGVAFAQADANHADGIRVFLANNLDDLATSPIEDFDTHKSGDEQKIAGGVKGDCQRLMEAVIVAIIRSPENG
mmetsp:Transcript_32521/g.53783  ORF Transcript_32521/g.53783 Transcript_32521/m.53783 type:complete len:213 (+) Transcript_32521:227-865(+)